MPQSVVEYLRKRELEQYRYPSEITGMIVYKEHDGLSTYYAKHKRDLPRPNYPVPALGVANER